MLHKTEVARFIKIKHSENDEGRCVICIIEVLDCFGPGFGLLGYCLVLALLHCGLAGCPCGPRLKNPIRKWQLGISERRGNCPVPEKTRILVVTKNDS